MKVAIVTYLGEEGGVYTHIKNIAIRISRFHNVELHIIVLSEKDCTEKLFGSTVHFIKREYFRAANYFYNPTLIKNKILEIDPDIVHVHQAFNYHSIAVCALTRKYPLIVTIHQGMADEIKNRLSPSLRRYIKLKINPYLEKRMLKRASHIIVLSPHVKEYFSDLKSKITVIPNGVDFEEIQNSGQKRDIAHPSIFFAGRLEKVKGVNILLRAIPHIKRLIPDVKVYIAGSGSEENKLKNLVKELNLTENVRFLGFISGDAKWSYYKSIDLCVVPSINEAFGLSSLEAMACGKPVVASNVGGIPYVVENGKTGLLFECGNIDDLAEKIIALLQNKELREKMEKAGQERAKEFSWDKITDRTVELYMKVTSKQNR